MNEETLKSIVENAEAHRNSVIKGDFDIRSILTHLLTIEIEKINYELDRKKESASQIYK